MTPKDVRSFRVAELRKYFFRRGLNGFCRPNLSMYKFSVAQQRWLVFG